MPRTPPSSNRKPPPPSRARRIAWLTAFVVMTVGCAAMAGWLDLHNGDVQGTIQVVAVSSFAVSALFAPGGWLGGILVGFGVPLAHLYARLAGIPLPYAAPQVLSSFVQLIPAVAGSIAGLALRAGVRHARS